MQNSRRPLLYLSVAFNYALGGLNTFGYHLFNLVVHILAGLALFALVRRTWLVERGKDAWREATGIGLAIATVWLVHPLQTQCVTYIIQRAEALMGLFFLLCLLASVRFFISAKKGWVLVAGLCALCSGLSKEVAVVLPVVVLWYDRTFFSRNVRDAIKRHGILYLVLSAVSGIMLYLFLTVKSEIIPTAGFALKSITPWQYAATQPGVVLYYLRLALVPWPLVFDYEWLPASTPFDIILPLVILWGIISLAISACRRAPGLGFLVLSFFVVLLPSSSIIPLKDLAFEHRMYLSLAFLVTFLVVVVWEGLKRYVPDSKNRLRVAGVVWLAVVSILGALTVARNRDYRSEQGMWQDVLAKRPLNSRAYNNYGRSLADEGKLDEAMKYYRRAIELSPRYADAYLNLGGALTEKGQIVEAAKMTEEAIRLNPLDGVAFNNYGAILMNHEQFKDAVPYFEQALDLNFRQAGVYHNLGMAFAKTGEPYKAIENIEAALRLNPNLEEAKKHLAEIKMRLKEEKQ